MLQVFQAGRGWGNNASARTRFKDKFLWILYTRKTFWAKELAESLDWERQGYELQASTIWTTSQKRSMQRDYMEKLDHIIGVTEELLGVLFKIVT